MNTVTVMGVTFDNRQQHIANLDENDKVYLLPEPTNKYDTNAIQVLVDEKMLGYIPKELAKLIKLTGTTNCLSWKRYGGYDDKYFGLSITFNIDVK